jgi:protein-tyrosine kinase
MRAMNDIERLFAGNRPVPGLRRSKPGRGKSSAAAATIEDLQPTVAPTRVEEADEHLVSADSINDGRYAVDGDAVAGRAVEGHHLVDVSEYSSAPHASHVVDPDVLADHDPLAEAFPIDEPAHLDHPVPLGEPVHLDDPVEDEQPRLRPGPQLLLAHDPFHPHAENVRLLRTELLLRHHAGQNEANAVAILGACVGEGRSQLACELALAFAQFGRPTLLVDADFRHPRVHALFGADLQDGLAQSITTGTEPVLRTVEGFPSLSVVTAGTCPPNPLELLTDGRFENFVAGWRRKYEFIVIDTPPISDYADGLAVATVIGRVLTVTRAKHTPYNKAREMLSRLAATEASIVGGVLNHF